VAPTLAAAALVSGAGVASAAEGDKYVGDTEAGDRVKLVTSPRGAVVRGAITSITDCSGSFDDFRARVEFGRPLDESTRGGFSQEAAFVEEDDRFSGRYKYLIEAERQTEREITGSFTLKVTFRRDGEKYATCRVEDLAFAVKRRD